MVVRTSKVLSKRRIQSGLGSALILSSGIIALALLLRTDARSGGETQALTQVVAEFDTLSVPVPLQPIPPGKYLRDVRFAHIEFPAHQVPAGAIVDLQEHLQDRALTTLPAHLPLFPANLSRASGALNQVIQRIPEGKRAMTVRVDATAAVEGWASAGAVVDVLVVTGQSTTVVAEKVKILSAERSIDPMEDGNPNVPSTVTLLVTQEQCLAINTAISLGKIAFALRSSFDEGSWQRTSYLSEDLKGNRIETPKRAKVNGYINVKGTEGTQSFALTDGQWVKTSVKPQGFFVADKEQRVISNVPEPEHRSRNEKQVKEEQIAESSLTAD